MHFNVCINLCVMNIQQNSNTNGLVQERCNSIANAQLHFSCTNPSICDIVLKEVT